MIQIMMTREELLNKNTQELDKELLQFQLERDKQQLASDVLATQQSISQSKRKLLEMKSQETLVPSAIVAEMANLDSLEQGLKALEGLGEELGLI